VTDTNAELYTTDCMSYAKRLQIWGLATEHGKTTRSNYRPTFYLQAADV